MGKLIVIKGPDEGRQFSLDAQHQTLGRERTNAVCLHDTEVSRRHAEISRDPAGGFLINDAGSSNGTLVNRRPVMGPMPLKSGDHVQIGRTILVFSLPKPEPSPDLADRIRLVTRSDVEFPSAVVRTVARDVGSRILARPDLVGTQWLKDRLSNLAVMYQAAQASSHILDPDLLLEKLMELIFTSIGADHGCVMLKETVSGEYVPKALRYRAGLDPAEKMTVSRTIMDHVLAAGEGVLISDVSRDARFGAGESVKRFRLREVICVPMQGRHDTQGVLFLDTFSQPNEFAGLKPDDTPGKFTEDSLALASAVAHQAALAVEDTAYHHALISAERLAAIGTTIAALSHHIKNIMQGVMFGADMLRAGLADKDFPVVERGWRMVEKNQGKIHALVLDMLSFSKEREPALEPCDVNAVVRDVLEMLAGRVNDGKVQLEVRLSTTLPLVPADVDGLHQAILNVVGNALDALEGVADKYLGVQTLLDAEKGRAKGRRPRSRTGHPHREDRRDFSAVRLDEGIARDGAGAAGQSQGVPRTWRRHPRRIEARKGIEIYPLVAPEIAISARVAAHAVAVIAGTGIVRPDRPVFADRSSFRLRVRVLQVEGLEISLKCGAGRA